MKAKTKSRKLAAVDPGVIGTPPGKIPSTTTTPGKSIGDPVRPDTPSTSPKPDDQVDHPGPGRGGPRPGAGRPPKTPPKLPEFTKAGLARLWELAFGMIAARKDDDDWQLDEDEAGNLAEATDPVLRQYLPLIGDHAALVALGITFALTVAPRHMLDQAKRRKAKDSSPSPDAEAGTAAVKVLSRTRPKTKRKGKSRK